MRPDYEIGLIIKSLFLFQIWTNVHLEQTPVIRMQPVRILLDHSVVHAALDGLGMALSVKVMTTQVQL